MIHTTPLGDMTSTWRDDQLFSLDWNTTDTCSEHQGRQGRRLDDRLQEYFETGRADFREVPICFDGWSEFHRVVYERCREIASGATKTYKQLAIEAGSPGASRAVGAAMARNRILLVIPCHRVVSTGGGLRGFSAPGGLKTKQFLLDLESKQTRFGLEASC